ncbi:MAG: NADH-quinone oxidoreductase subunit NuoK [Deltaproteobacteria bacterium]|nr:MAG: NADH-quinone oxidoreductase subunit NuoK [Deltaproteobacteria bacterium]RLB03000.1 MAG: NADH-quinone oxidoreductase subunit NuoK [Deltaproteobacteria bacterium]
MIPPALYLALSAVIFTIGVIGVLLRRDAIVIFMCIEMMLSAVGITLIAASRYLHSMDGVIFVFLAMTVAAAEAAVGLAIFVLLHRIYKGVKVDEINLMKW